MNGPRKAKFPTKFPKCKIIKIPPKKSTYYVYLEFLKKKTLRRSYNIDPCKHLVMPDLFNYQAARSSPVGCLLPIPRQLGMMNGPTWSAAAAPLIEIFNLLANFQLNTITRAQLLHNFGDQLGQLTDCWYFSVSSEPTPRPWSTQSGSPLVEP